MSKFTVAELKRRMVVGSQWLLTHTLMGPCNKLRVVSRVTTVDVQFTGDGIADGRVSHLSWPKADKLREIQNGFEIWEDGVVAVRYTRL